MEHDAERVDVGAVVWRAVAFVEFWSGVFRCAHGGPRGTVAVLLFHEAGEAKVCEFGLAVGIDEDVAGFDVAVDDAAAVGEGDGVAYFREDFDGSAWGKLAVADELEDGAAFDEFHYEDAEAVGDGEVEDSRDIRVGEAGHGLGLGAEAFDGFAVAGGIGRENLDGDRAIEVALKACVDGSHSPRGDDAFHGELGEHVFQ